MRLTIEEAKYELWRHGKMPDFCPTVAQVVLAGELEGQDDGTITN